MLISAGGSETFEGVTPIGIGLVECAISLTKLCLLSKPKSLTFIGTVGSYGRYKILDIITSAISSNIEQSFLNGNSYTPLDNVVESNVEIKKNVIVNSSNYITTSKKISKEFLELKLEVENMEFFSVLSVAKNFNIPVNGIFVVTNYCYENAHEEFLENHNEAKQLLKEIIDKKQN